MVAPESPGFSLIRKLNFTFKESQTPHRNQERHRQTQEPFSVCLRVRPPVNDEQAFSGSTASRASTSTVIVNSESMVETLPPPESQSYRSGERGTQFTFSHAFAPHATQRHVYRQSAAPLVRSLLQGKNGLLFAYGITNSGKTYTIQGTSADPGIMPRALADLFRIVETPKQCANCIHAAMEF